MKQRYKGIRVVTLADLSDPLVMGRMKGRYYSDTPALVFRGMGSDYKSNALLIKKLAPLVEERTGRLDFPLLLTGFDVVLSENKEGYGLDIVAREDFSAFRDERLLSRYDGMRFSSVDKYGLPNFVDYGSRKWYTCDEGVSRILLNKNLALCQGYADGRSLAVSSCFGRVVLVRDSEDRRVED